MSAALEIVVADITTLEVDAIVNAANRGTAASPAVAASTARSTRPRVRRPCGTRAGRWRRAHPTRRASRHRASLELASAHGVASIAFPAISAGAYRFPLRGACEIAVAAVRAVTAAHPLPSRVVFCMYDERAAAAMRAALL
jgi:O-acetyl-ADP-ribose deacetylase (regulator of RNase III)